MNTDNMKTFDYYKKSKLLERWDIIVAVILVLALAAVLLITFLPAEGSEVEIYKNGQLIAVYPLNENRAFNVGAMRIEIFDGKVSVVESDCPDQLCVHAHSIFTAGSVIICVPNKVVVKITGKTEVEGITQ
ncbi:MAG: NusG domain II-containing protein [Clostridia bacterium]|nr:NusG domain II-containing protein [Clostridia bacterium]